MVVTTKVGISRYCKYTVKPCFYTVLLKLIPLYGREYRISYRGMQGNTEKSNGGSQRSIALRAPFSSFYPLSFFIFSRFFI